jgi:hypothetical protein
MGSRLRLGLGVVVRRRAIGSRGRGLDVRLECRPTDWPSSMPLVEALEVGMFRAGLEGADVTQYLCGRVWKGVLLGVQDERVQPSEQLQGSQQPRVGCRLGLERKGGRRRRRARSLQTSPKSSRKKNQVAVL